MVGSGARGSVRRGRGVRAALVALVTGAVVISMSGPAAAAVASGGQDAQPAAPVADPPPPAQSATAVSNALPPGLGRPAGRQTGTATKTQLHAFALATSEVTPVRAGMLGRAGGIGVSDIVAARRGMPGVNAAGLVLTMPGP